MLTKNRKGNRLEQRIICTEELVPKEHLLRDIERAIDFSFIYGFVSELYSDNNGRPSIDPVVLFKIVFIQFLFGIRSMRQTIREIEVNMACRWFLGYGMIDKVSHFTTFGKNYARRFANSDIFEKIFERILLEAVNAGFVDASAVFIDAAHIKASANNKKSVNEVVKIEAKHYHCELLKEINADRIEHGKKPPKDDSDNDNCKFKNVKKSTTDPDCGMFHKGEHKKEFAYIAHVACDKHCFVLGCGVSAGNVHDSVMFDDLYSNVIEKFPETNAVAIDSGYKTPWIMKQAFDRGHTAFTPYKRPMTKEGFFKKYDYVYDEFYDCVICPENQVLKYSTTNKNGYKEFKSDPNICWNCPSRNQCTESKNCQKIVDIHVWQDYMEKAEDARHSNLGKEIHALRSQTIERVFADAKENLFMRYSHKEVWRGLKCKSCLLLRV